MDFHSSGPPSKGTRWTNSRLSRRVPLISEDSDDSDGGNGAGVSINSSFPKGSSTPEHRSTKTDNKDNVNTTKSPIANAQSTRSNSSPGKTAKAGIPKSVSKKELKATATMNANKAIANNNASSSASQMSTTPLNVEKLSQHAVTSYNSATYSTPMPRTHIAHRSMDLAIGQNTTNSNVNSSGGGLQSFSSPILARTSHHSIHQSLDFAMTGKQRMPNQVAPAAVLGGATRQRLLPNNSPDVSGEHIHGPNKGRLVDSPDVMAMLFQKLNDSARGLSVNSSTLTPGFGEETPISLGLEHRSPPNLFRNPLETDQGNAVRAQGARKLSTLNSVMSLSSGEKDHAGSSQAQVGGLSATSGIGCCDGNDTPMTAFRGRTNTVPSFSGRQQQLRTLSLAVEERADDMMGGLERHSQNGAVDPYAHGLPGSVSTGALMQRTSTPVLPLSLSTRSSPTHHDAALEAAIIKKVAAAQVGPLDFNPVTEDIWNSRSAVLNQLTGTEGCPSLRDIVHPWYVPFTEKCRFVEQSNAGVICITNIPYEVSRAEIFAFLGRSADTLNDRDEPVHIIMDRLTSKVNECYVEFASFDEAITAVTRYQNAIENGIHVPKVGTREVEVMISNQAQLMEKLFPLAKGVEWQEVPFRIIRDSPHQWDNFKGFTTQEEMTLLSKHAEGYNNPVFAKKCPERPYECMISTIKKYPWHLSEHITIQERGYLYEASLNMVAHLQKRISKGEVQDRLTPQLLNRLAEAVLSCPGFSVSQKDNIAYRANMPWHKMRDMGQPRFAESWRHLQVLNVKEGASLDIVEYYIAIIREETTRIAGLQPISQQQRLLAEQKTSSDYWGFF